MDQQVHNDLCHVFNDDFVQVGEVSLSAHYEGDFHYGFQAHSLHITFYINQLATLEKKDIFQILEEKIGDISFHGNSRIRQRYMNQEHSENYKITYEIIFHDFEEFGKGIKHFAKLKADKEFIQALEAKLQE